jgi:hypothetical protein
MALAQRDPANAQGPDRDGQRHHKVPLLLLRSIASACHAKAQKHSELGSIDHPTTTEPLGNIMFAAPIPDGSRGHAGQRGGIIRGHEASLKD